MITLSLAVPDLKLFRSVLFWEFRERARFERSRRQITSADDR